MDTEFGLPLRLSLEKVTSYFRTKRLRIVFAVLWILFVGLIITSGFKPNPYAQHVLDNPEPYSYPMALVVILVVAMLFHLSLLVTIDVYMHNRWKLLTMLIITILFLIFFGMMALHAQPPLGTIIAWTFLSFLLLLVLCFWQAYLFILRRVFRRE